MQHCCKYTGSFYKCKNVANIFKKAYFGICVWAGFLALYLYEESRFKYSAVRQTKFLTSFDAKSVVVCMCFFIVRLV